MDIERALVVGGATGIGLAVATAAWIDKAIDAIDGDGGLPTGRH